jgi:hypothetical protein
VCSKKSLTGPTLLEMYGNGVYQDLATWSLAELRGRVALQSFQCVGFGEYELLGDSDFGKSFNVSLLSDKGSNVLPLNMNFSL